MKKELIFMLTAAALGTVFFSNITADKASAKTSGDYRYVVTGKKKKTCAIRKYLGKDKDVVVPDKIDGYKVTRIGNRAFKNNDKIKSVKLPKYVTIIGESSFYDCYKLENITFPQKVHTIKKKAFRGCSSLKSISLPDKLKKIENYTFNGCALREINIPQNVKSIGTYAFYCNFYIGTEYQNSLTSITVDKRNKTFDSRDNCNAIIKTSSNTLIMGSNKTVIPDSVTAIDEFAFNEYTIEEITIPSSVKKIGSNAFSYCESLKKVNFSEGLISIDKDAFHGCSSLKEMNLPDSVESIGDCAFYGCFKIESIYIPKNLKKMGWMIINSELDRITPLSSVTKITVAEGNPYYDSRDNCNAVIETASNTIVMACENTVIPNTVKAIGEYAFLTTPSELVIPDGVETIANCAFESKTKLKEVTIPSSVRSIGDYAFDYCTSLERINLSEGLINIGRRAFTQCSSLRDIQLPDSVETIGESAFTECPLTSIRIPKNLKKTDIGAIFSAFDYIVPDCPTITKITVAEGNPNYDSRDNCNAVIETASNTLVLACKNTVIPKTVKVINRAFLNCDPELVIPEGVEEIADFAFEYRDDLKKITLPSSLKSIGFSPFEDSLKTINYRGSKAQWKKIKIDTGSKEFSNNWLTGVKINYNYKG